MTESLKCSACGTPYHEASGHWFTDKTRLCGPCAKDMVKFVKRQLSRRWGKVRFYDYAFPAKDEPCENSCCKQPKGHPPPCDFCGCEP